MLRLPGELRNFIYMYALQDNHYDVPIRLNNQGRSYPVAIPLEDRSDTPRCSLHNGASSGNHLALLRTCRQVYEETKGTHVQLSTFHFGNPASFNDFRFPSGVQSIVIHTSVVLRPLGALPQLFWADGISHADIAGAYALWGTTATIKNIHFEVECDHPVSWCREYDPMMGMIKQLVSQWALAFVGETRKKTGAMQGKVNITITVFLWRGKVIFSTS